MDCRSTGRCSAARRDRRLCRIADRPGDRCAGGGHADAVGELVGRGRQLAADPRSRLRDRQLSISLSQQWFDQRDARRHHRQQRRLERVRFERGSASARLAPCDDHRQQQCEEDGIAPRRRERRLDGEHHQHRQCAGRNHAELDRPVAVRRRSVFQRRRGRSADLQRRVVGPPDSDGDERPQYRPCIGTVAGERGDRRASGCRRRLDGRSVRGDARCVSWDLVRRCGCGEPGQCAGGAGQPGAGGHDVHAAGASGV